MKKMLIILACMLVLLLTSCGPKPTPKPADPATPPAAEDPQTPETPAAPTAFVSSEVTDFFQQTEQDILKKFGKPTKENVYELSGDEKAKDMIYPNDGTFAVAVTPNQMGEIFRGAVISNKIEHPRGIKIGDTLESVLAKFPNESDGTKTKDDDPDLEDEIIYGEYVSMSSFGVLKYKSGVPVSFMVSDQDLALSILFKDKKVSEVDYLISVN